MEAATPTQKWWRYGRYVVHCYISVRVAATGVQGLGLCATLASGDGEERHAGVAGTRYQCLNEASVAPGPGLGVKGCSGRGDLIKSMHGKLAGSLRTTATAKMEMMAGSKMAGKQQAERLSRAVHDATGRRVEGGTRWHCCYCSSRLC